MSKTCYAFVFFLSFFFFRNLPLLWTIKQQVAPTKKLISCSSQWTRQFIWIVLYFILLENPFKVPSLCNSFLPPTYWGILSKTVEDLTTEKVATELIFLLARSGSTATPERYDFAQWEWWKHDTCDLWYWQNGWFLTLVVHKPEKKTPRDPHVSTNLARYTCV